MTRISLRVPQSLRDWLELQADAEHRNLNEQVTYYLDSIRKGRPIQHSPS